MISASLIMDAADLDLPEAVAVLSRPPRDDSIRRSAAGNADFRLHPLPGPFLGNARDIRGLF